MPILRVLTGIDAPPKRVFDLARSIDFHQASSSHTGERAIEGQISGLIELNQTVTWEARHFGLVQRLTVRITEYDRPAHFQDSMVKGAFARLVHDHSFIEKPHGTMMVDRFDFASPFGPAGRLVDHLFLARYLRKFLVSRNTMIKQVAESDEWRKYLPSA